MFMYIENCFYFVKFGLIQFIFFYCLLQQGIPLKPGQNRDSIMSAIPLTNSTVRKEMNDAHENCVTIGEEIEQLKKEMNDLINVNLKKN